MSAARAARAFVAIGGRIMLNPDGKLVSMIDAGRVLERTWPNAETPAPFVARRRIARHYDQVERRSRDAIMRLVAQHGRPVNGWLVWGGRA